MLILISFVAFICTFLGGLFALRFKDRLHLILGFSAGAVLAVAFFDLIPESIEMTSGSFDASTTMTIVALGFLFYMIIDRWIKPHAHRHEAHGAEGGNENSRGSMFGAGSFVIHSFIDGIAIGLSFQASVAVGVVVTVAVLAHDFSDGINTVNMVLRNRGSRRKALTWLAADAAAPVLGVLTTFFFTITQSSLGLILALLSGFFLYIGASDLLPESHHNHPTRWTTFMTILGVTLLFLIIRIAE